MDTNSILLPHILESLSRKPKLCDTYDNLCNELEEVLSQENIIGDFRKHIKKALDVGESLGILTLTNEIVRVPFKLRSNDRVPNSKAVNDQEFDDVEDDTQNSEPKGRRRIVPNQLPHVPSERKRSSSRRGGRRSGSEPKGRRRIVPNQLPHGPSERKRSGSRRGGRRSGSRSVSRRGSSHRSGSHTPSRSTSRRRAGSRRRRSRSTRR